MRKNQNHDVFDEQAVAEIYDAMRRIPKRAIYAGFGALAAVLAGVTSYYQIEPDEVGVVRRLGAHVRTVEPGPHFKLPFGVEQVTKLPAARQQKLEFGFRSDPAVRVSPDMLARESLMLTGDLNVADVEWTVQYQIREPVDFLYKNRDVVRFLREIAESSMRAVVGDHSVNEVLTTGREKIAQDVSRQLQELASKYETGIEIQQVVLMDVNPPDPVKPSFNEVNQAIQEKERAVNEAQAELNQQIPRARGMAERSVREAEGYAIERVNRARGEAQRFTAVLSAYEQAPDVTRRRMYLETMSEVLPKAGQKVLVDGKTEEISPLLPMANNGVSPAVVKGVSQ